MSNLVLPIAGAAIGSFFGPYGASIGWAIGSYAESGNQTIQQPKLGDLRIQTSQYGSIIPIVVGRERIAGNIIWSSPKREYKVSEQQGKGGGPTIESTGYKIDLAIALCEGELQGIGRIWANEEVIINAGDNLLGALYTGTITQIPNSLMESHEGVGNVPAYTGISYIMVEDYNLGLSGVVPQFSFEIIKKGGGI